MYETRHAARSWLANLPSILFTQLVMVFCTCVYAIMAVIAKIVERHISSMEVVGFRSFFAGLATVLLSAGTVYHSKEKAADEGRDAPTWCVGLFGPPELYHLLAMRGVIGSVAFALLYAAYPMLSIAEHVSIQFLNPVFLVLLAWPVNGERPSKV